MKKLICFIVFAILISLCGCSPQNGFVKTGGFTYYYDNGVLQTGWKNINGDWYYFSENDVPNGERKGTMEHNAVLMEGDDWYYFSDDGKMMKNYWVLNNGEKLHYCGSDGKIVKNKTININGQEYSFDADGKEKKLIFQIPYFGNVYLKDSLPKKVEKDRINNTYYGQLYDNLEFDFSTAHYYTGDYLYLNIYGIVERLSGKTGKVYVHCRMSAVDQSGITISDTDSGSSDSLSVGEKGRIAWKIELGQFKGCSDLYLEFE